MILKDKKILITGLLSKNSIAYGIAESLYKQGAYLAFTYQLPELESRVKKIAKEFGSELVFQCDVSDDKQITDVFIDLTKDWERFDGIVHSIAFCTPNAFTGKYVDSVTRENFRVAHDISSYSLAALTKAALPMLNQGSSILAISYDGSNKAVPGYNVMGLAKASLESNVRYLANDLGPMDIRVNCISAGPHKTFATMHSPVIDKSLENYRKYSPIRRNVTTDEIGDAAAFLLSDLASAVTGHLLYVDGGYNIVDNYTQ
jgi:enoyl-[acyl-carrier protein] reductase I